MNTDCNCTKSFTTGSEYPCKRLACIKEKKPDCMDAAVIPSITVESADGITNLANCLVHAIDTNTTYYVDDKHRVMITWAGPVNIPGYDMETNPNGYKNQIITDVKAQIASIYDNRGTGYIFGLSQNLDLQEEVNNKLDEMAADGTLAEIITEYVQLRGVLAYNTVAEMKLAENLSDGSFVETYGYYSAGDLGGAKYKVRETTNQDNPDNATIIALHDSNLVAELVLPSPIRPEIFGAHADGETNDTSAFNKMFSYILNLPKVSEGSFEEFYGAVCEGTYYVGTINIPSNLENVILNGNNKGTFKHGGFVFSNTTGYRTKIIGLNFIECTNPVKMNYRNIEFSDVEIKSCVFARCTGTCLDIHRRSGQVYVLQNKFAECEKVAVFEDCDLCHFDDNWVETGANQTFDANTILIEQVCPNEGSIFIKNNNFVPGKTQTNANVCWIKIGRNANIEGNRFSGEFVGIHPIVISQDNFSDFSVDDYMYNIVNFTNNPIVAGSSSILIDQITGELNIHNNSFLSTNPVIELTSNGESVMDSLSYTSFFISLKDNGGRSLNFRNNGWHSLSGGKPIIPKILQKFIKKAPMYALNENLNIEAVRDGKILKIKTNTTVIDEVTQLQFFVTGMARPNPEGNPNYTQSFCGIMTLDRDYLYTPSEGIALVPKFALLTGNDPSLATLTPTINGQAQIYTDSATLGANIQLELTYSSYSNTSTVDFKACVPLELLPSENPDTYYGNDWAVSN